jgi:hypothetical protein
VFDHNGWSPQSPAMSPGPRKSGAFAFDGTTMILFGGQDNLSQYNGETWSWDGTNWNKLSPATSPSARTAAVAAYDPIGHQLVMFGGVSPGTGFSDETWTFDGTNWHDASSGFRPAKMGTPTLTFNPNRGKLTLIGGAIETLAYEWDGTNWAVIPAPRPPVGRAAHATVMTPRGTGLLIYGGSVIQDASDPSSANTDDDRLELRWDGPSGGDERCDGSDIDDDGLVGCADPDCWYVCAPLCPTATSCAQMPTCGDGTCDASRESCRTCADDCGSCAPICGDGFCDTGETCAGDCP